MQKQKNEIKIVSNAIIVLDGIECEEKKHFTQHLLFPFFKQHNLFFKNISNIEDIEIDLDKFTCYPSNVNIVIVNIGKTNEEILQVVHNISKQNHYTLITIKFDYVIKTLSFNTKKNKNVYNIHSNDLTKYFISYEQKINQIPPVHLYDKYCVIGDVHGCLDELIECVTDHKGIIYNKKTNELTHPVDENLNEHYYHHILIGDYIDKGPQIEETIKFLYENRAWFWIVKGNHEKFVYKFLKDKLGTYEHNKKLIENHFTTILLLQNNETLKLKFFELFENSYEFIKTNNFIVTHSPCEEKYLGKVDSISKKMQINITYPHDCEYDKEEDFEKAMKEHFSFLYQQAKNENPYHIFGHIALKDVFRYKNEIGIDTGCVYGNNLSTFVINEKESDYKIVQYKSKRNKTEELKNVLNF